MPNRDVYNNVRGRGGGVGGGGGGVDFTTRKVTDTKVKGKAYGGEAGAEELYDKKGDGHENVRVDISEVETDEMRKDKLNGNRNNENEADKYYKFTKLN